MKRSLISEKAWKKMGILLANPSSISSSQSLWWDKLNTEPLFSHTFLSKLNASFDDSAYEHIRNQKPQTDILILCWDHSFSAYGKLFEKLIFLTRWYGHVSL